MKTPHAELDEPTLAKIETTLLDILPRVLPSDWHPFRAYANTCWYKSSDGIAVCCEVEMHDDAGLWLHVSMSRKDRTPTYFDMSRVKNLFVGDKRKAIQVFPAAEEHYNYHPYCLHLWSPLENDPLPDLRTREGQL